ncbi:MAG: hypothetical protein EAX91_15540 [Candidatus Lokiarchaeota archaeon]|nr:hypothetical protein [Candidatus Lokiarchaeota archaeon]
MASKLVKEAEMINQYLCEIKNNLPLWIRLNKTELNEILNEIEDHIWEIAIENTENKKPNETDLQIAISQIGDPKELANKYTAKSTPRVFISNELWPFFLRYLKIILFSCIFSMLFPFAWSFVVFGINLESLSFYMRLYLLIIYISLGLVISIVFFYLSTYGYIPYESRITRFYKKYSNMVYIQDHPIKNPVNSKFLGIWAFIWLFGAIFFYLSSAVTTPSGELPNPTGYFYAILCLILFAIKVIRIKFSEQFEVLHLILIVIEFLLIFLLMVLYTSLDYRHQHGFQDFEVVIFLLVFFQVLGFPIVLITINYKIYQIFTFKNKYGRYQIFLSLNKRIIKKQSYVKHLKNDKSEDFKNDLRNQEDSIRELNQNNEVEEKLASYINSNRKKLPFWLRKTERDVILNEVESEVRELILDYEDDKQLTPEKITQIFEQVGDINTIISELKQKGTPKIFISDELWAWYKGAFKATIAYIIIIGLFLVSLTISFNSFYIGGLPLFISLMWFSLTIFLIILSGIFVILSMTDYIPYTMRYREKEWSKIMAKNKQSLWKVMVLIFFALCGLIFILLSLLLAELSTDFRVPAVVLLIGLMLLALTGNESILLFLHRHFIKFRILLLLLNLVLLLALNFIIFYNAHAQLGFLKYSIIEFLFFFFFYPINIEIVYVLFRIFQANIQ